MSDMHEIQEFTGIAPDRFERICADIKAKTGIVIAQDEGEASAKGITISWKYDRAKQDLTVQTLKRSWFDPPEDQIDQKIHVEIEGTK
jgi:hypothetical protein